MYIRHKHNWKILWSGKQREVYALACKDCDQAKIVPRWKFWGRDVGYTYS